MKRKAKKVWVGYIPENVYTRGIENYLCISKEKILPKEKKFKITVEEIS